MNDHQAKFLELAKKYEALSEQLGVIREDLNTAMHSIGYDQYIQDPETGLVYKIIVPLGTFTHYKTIDYKRTAKEGERGGTVLSKKEAEEQGFVLRK